MSRKQQQTVHEHIFENCKTAIFFGPEEGVRKSNRMELTHLSKLEQMYTILELKMFTFEPNLIWHEPCCDGKFNFVS